MIMLCGDGVTDSEGICMNCDFDCCIYNRKFRCILNKIHLNSLGMCDECMIVSIPDDVLDELKEKQMEEIEQYWRNYE